MIDILLTTYNGERFLVQQLDSVLSQDGAEFRVLVRDDGSTDGTREIIGKYAARDGRISEVEDGLGNIGVRRSFMTLVERSDAEYFMFCDQDDVWLPGKVASSLEKIVEMQTRYSDDVPLLVFTDLKVVDSELNVIDPSFWHYQRLDPRIGSDWRGLLAQNVVTGSTLIANAAARRASLPFVLDEMMHDHWIAVNAAKAGYVGYLPAPTVLYRQHGVNTEGARRASGKYLAGNAGSLMRRMPFYRKAAAHFGGVGPGELFLRKVVLNLRRMFR